MGAAPIACGNARGIAFRTSRIDAFAGFKQGSTSRVFRPQVGEKILPFKVQGVFDQAAGQEIDFVAQANGKPLVLIFVHDVNRQSISFTRVLSTYTLGRKPEELATGIVWLSDDATEAESTLKRIRHALGPQVAGGTEEKREPDGKKRTDEKKTDRRVSTDAAAILKLLPSAIGVSPEGREGPGSYGLNRKMTLTILVAKENKVEANFALVQPSLQADLPKVLESIVKVAGGKIPKLEELDGMPAMARQPAADGQAPNLRPLLQPLIRLGASEEDVDKAAQAIEKQAQADPATRREVIRIATTIINAVNWKTTARLARKSISPSGPKRSSVPRSDSCRARGEVQHEYTFGSKFDGRS